MGEGEVGLAVAFLGGLLSFLSPCVLPLVPPYLAFLAATEADREAAAAMAVAAPRRRTFIFALSFVLGLATVFVGLGAAASTVGGLLAEHRLLLSQIAGVVIIIFGLHFVGVFRIPMLYRDIRFNGGRLAGSLPGAYTMGLAFAFGWTPCIGPVLATILFWAAQEATLAKGTVLLAAYSAGLGTPFLAAAAFVGPFNSFLKRFRRHLRRVEAAMGVFLILIGIAFITGAINSAAWWLLEAFPILGRIG